jgi:hypothetical protein
MSKRHIFHAVAHLLGECSTITLAADAKEATQMTSAAARVLSSDVVRGHGDTTVISLAVVALALGGGAARIEGGQLVTAGSRLLREPPRRTVPMAAASPVPPPPPVKQTERQAEPTLLADAGGHSLVLPLPLALSLDSGIDHRGNDYRTDASDINLPAGVPHR